MQTTRKNPNDNHSGKAEKKTDLKIYCHFKNKDFTSLPVGQYGGKAINSKIEKITPITNPNISPLSKWLGKIVDKFI